MPNTLASDSDVTQAANRAPLVDPSPVSGGLNLLRFRWIRLLILSPLFPLIIQAAVLAVFVGLAYFSWATFPPDGVDDKLYAKTHLVTLIIWGFWWPAMVWTAVLFGRAWCAVCPLELVANGAERLGRTLGVKQRILGKWLRSGALIVGLYALIQMLVAGAHLHRVPAYTSFFLWGLLAFAALVGFFLKDRAFCRGFCPVGLLLSTYGRGGKLAVRPTSLAQCASCTGKDCVRACNRTRLDARSCPSLLNPAKLNSNTDCLVCGQCIKVCADDNVGNMGLYLRRLFHSANAREALASWPVTMFVMVVSGFVVSELLSEWRAGQTAFLWPPERVADSIGLTAYAGWIEGVWTLFVVPSIMWLILASLVFARDRSMTLGVAWRSLALPMAVVISAGHMCKGLAKVVSWIGFLPLAANDPAGVATARAIAAGAIPQPAAILPMAAVSVLAVLLIFAGGYFAAREARLSQPETYRRLRTAIWATTVCFGFIVLSWGFLQ
jgi:polyferredoxin